MEAVADTIPRLLQRNAHKFSGLPAYRVKEFGIWRSWTWSETEKEIKSLAVGFLACGVARKDHIAVIGSNRPELYWAMVAAQSIGAIPVPVYQDSVPEEMVYILEHCNVKFVVAEDQEQVDKVIELSDRLNSLEKTIFLDPRGLRKYDRAKLISFGELQELGKIGDTKLTSKYNSSINDVAPTDTCVMLYTSGTTGNPKGVVLSHKNIISQQI